MNKVEQDIKALYENNIDYCKEFAERNQREMHNSIEIVFTKEKLPTRLLNNTLSIITGNNGVGKSYTLKELYTFYNNHEYKVQIFILKEISEIDEIIRELKRDTEIIIFDGLDEININIYKQIKEYIFKGLKDKKVIISSRKDLLMRDNMLNSQYNIYEVLPLYKKEVKNALKRKLEDSKINSLMSVLGLPRYLKGLIENFDELKKCDNLTKYKIMNLMVEKDLEELNSRSNFVIEKDIHLKILQSLALSMMMAGKINITKEELTQFFSRIEQLDIKHYIISPSIINVFINNQVLLNNGKSIQFENKEVMEFLAAKEIIENRFSNDNLYKIVTDVNKDINMFWFNVLSYLVCEDKVYKELLYKYIDDNLLKDYNVINLLEYLYFDNNIEFAENIFIKALRAYTGTHQYLENNNTRIYDIFNQSISNNINSLIDELEKIDYTSNLDDFKVIYVNNIQTLFLYAVEKRLIGKYEKNRIIDFLKNNINYCAENEKIRVRFISLLFKICTPRDIDKFLKNRRIDSRLVSLLIYECPKIEKLSNIYEIINKYILEFDSFYEEDSLFVYVKNVIDFMIKKYSEVELINLLNQIDNDKKMINFVNFFYDYEKEIITLFDNKSMAPLIKQKVFDRLVNNDYLVDYIFSKNMLLEYKRDNVLYSLMKVCINNNLNIQYNTKTGSYNYNLEYISKLEIIALIEKGENINDIYNRVINKGILFNVWLFDLDDTKKEDLEPEIKKIFRTEYCDYKKREKINASKNYKAIEKALFEIDSSSNILFIIGEMNKINEDSISIIKTDEELNTIYERNINKIYDFVEKFKIDEINVELLKKQKVIPFLENYYYSIAIKILYNEGYDIEKYNDKNIIVLMRHLFPNKINYSNSNLQKLINYISKSADKEYIKHYLSSIIEYLRFKKYNELCNIIYKLLNKYEFEEFEMNQMLDVLCDDEDKINHNKISKILKNNKYKSCQDVLILSNYEDEIKNRVNYIKENFVIKGDPYKDEFHNSIEYFDESYSNPLKKISIKYIDYIADLVEFAFKKNKYGDYYFFLEYTLKIASAYIKNNIKEPSINKLIIRIIQLEKECEDKRFYKTCYAIKNLKNIDEHRYVDSLIQLNEMLKNNNIEILTYDELVKYVENILNNKIFNDIKRMRLFDIFKDETTEGKKVVRTLKEQTYQLLIGYELERIMNLSGYNVKVNFETMGYDKKRGDIQIISEGFINDIILETKLVDNNDISNKDKTKEYVQNKLKSYSEQFNSPKILFVLINQKNTKKLCEDRIKYIEEANNEFVVPLLIDLKDEFDRIKKENK